ncbi:MAG: class I tRNA ligase family protein, partial [Acidimicrobiia bacterium]|nr:class I tRNA ligase family protein [Acidimicrobiia bacterium]
DVNQLKHHLDVQRMSKSRGNVVNPDLLVSEYGADTVRTHLMFAFEWQKGGPWDSRGIVGSRRFIEDVWKLGTAVYQPGEVDPAADVALRRNVHQTIHKVGADFEEFKWNTAIAALMTLRNQLGDARRAANVSEVVWNEGIETLLLLLAPAAPHITEELWTRRGHAGSIHVQTWPAVDLEAARDDLVTMVVQVNGKVRDRVEVSADISAEDAEAVARGLEKIQGYLAEGEVRKVIVREPNVVNLVVA